MNYQWLYKIKFSENSRYMSIYKERYESVSSYHYDFKVNNDPAFVVVNTEILQLITRIQQLDKQLYSLEPQLPSLARAQFTQKCLIDEIKQTNELEGVASTRKEIKEVLDNKAKKNSRLSGIVQKYTLLLTKNTVPLRNCQDVRNLYNEFVLTEVKETNPEDLPDGDIFRKNRVYVKSQSSGKVVHEGLYPETKIIETMSSLLSILDNVEYNPFINIAVIHYMFGYIHPFYDGNGRTSRFISSYLLSEHLEKLVSFRLAYTIKKDIKKYYKMFNLSNDPINKGDLTPFTIYFLSLIHTSLKELVIHFTDQLERLKFYLGKIDTKINKSQEYKHTLYILVQGSMFGNEGLSIKELSDAINKSDTTTRGIVKELEKDNFLIVTKARPVLYNADLEKIAEL